MNQVTINNKTVDFEAAVNLMDDDIREELHSAQDWESEQEFMDAYAAKHEEKYNEVFEVA